MQLFSNNAKSNLASGINNVATSVTLTTGKGALFSSPTGGDYELVTLSNREGSLVEIVKMTSRSTDTLTIVRGQEGTIALSWTTLDTIEGRITRDTLKAFPQFDFGGNARGTDSVNLQPRRLNAANVASGASAIAIGFDTKASSLNSIALGASSVSSGSSSVTFGSSSTSSGDQSVCVGVSSTASGTYSLAAGFGSIVTGAQSIGIGVASGNTKDNTNVISGVSLVKNITPLLSGILELTGSEGYIFSVPIDLKVVTDYVVTLTMPTGTSFYPTELGVIVSSANTVTVQPNVSFGITGNSTSLLASTPTTKSAVKGKDVFTPISGDGVTSLTTSVKVGATATTLTGRFYFKGILVED